MQARTPAWLIRILAFVRKDVVEIVRQPQLLIGVILGPFILLLVFGASLGDLAPELTTVVVAQRDSALANLFEQFRFNPSGRFEISEITPDRDDALERLRDGEIDIVLVLPNEPQQTIRRGEPAEAILYHNFIDPLEARAIGTATQLSVGELNESFVAALLRDAQASAVEVGQRLDETREAVGVLRTSLEDDDVVRARRAVPDVRRNLAAARLLLGPTAAAAAEGTGDDLAGTPLRNLNRTLDTLDTLTAAADPAATDTARLAQIEADLARAREELDVFTSLTPEVAISPLSSRVERVQGGTIALAAFYAPAVLVLLGQHLVVTTVALATVQEEQYGTVELFAVAPLKPAERLLGRYGGALALSLPTMAVMVALLVGGLGVPMLGSWLLLAATVTALLLTSIGIGFLIAELSGSASQAVQLAMGVLLASVFFSGFVLSTKFFVGVGALAGLALPATYAIQALRDVMLRGEVLRTAPYLVLPAAALVLFALNWLLLQRTDSQRLLARLGGALPDGIRTAAVSGRMRLGRAIERARQWTAASARTGGTWAATTARAAATRTVRALDWGRRHRTAQRRRPGDTAADNDAAAAVADDTHVEKHAIDAEDTGAGDDHAAKDITGADRAEKETNGDAGSADVVDDDANKPGT